MPTRNHFRKTYLVSGGDGQQPLSFHYLDDVVERLANLMETDTAVAGPVNLGDSKEYTMCEVVQEVPT